MHCNTVRWLTDRSEQLGNYDDENLSLLMNFSSTTLLMNSFSDKPIGWPASPRTKNYVFQRMMLHFGAWNLRQDQLLRFHPMKTLIFLANKEKQINSWIWKLSLKTRETTKARKMRLESCVLFFARNFQFCGKWKT